MTVDTEIIESSSARLFSEEQLTPLFTTRAQALNSTDPTERERLMEAADTERTRLLYSIQLSSEQRRALNYNLADIYRQLTTRTIPQAVTRGMNRFDSLPPAVPAANPQDVTALQAQLLDMQLKHLFDDPPKGTIINREAYMKAGIKLFRTEGRRVITIDTNGNPVSKDQSLALAQALVRKDTEPKTPFRGGPAIGGRRPAIGK